MIRALKILLRKSAAKKLLALKDAKDRGALLREIEKDKELYTMIIEAATSVQVGTPVIEPAQAPKLEIGKPVIEQPSKYTLNVGEPKIENAKPNLTIGPISMNADDQKNRLPTISDLITILSDNQINESIDLKHKHSDTAFKKWALVSAVLDYYTQLNKNVDFQIADNFGDNKLVHELAPNQKEIYNIWIRKLYEGVRQKALGEQSYLESYESGAGRGTSFEKLLERYRKDFMNQIWQKVA